MTSTTAAGEVNKQLWSVVPRHRAPEINSLNNFTMAIRDDALTRLLGTSGTCVCDATSFRHTAARLSSDLSTVTLKRNADLETRVGELELELSVWKQAHSNVLEMVERDKKAHNVQVATLNRQLSSLDAIKVSIRFAAQRPRYNAHLSRLRTPSFYVPLTAIPTSLTKHSGLKASKAVVPLPNSSPRGLPNTSPRKRFRYSAVYHFGSLYSWIVNVCWPH